MPSMLKSKKIKMNQNPNIDITIMIMIVELVKQNGAKLSIQTNSLQPVIPCTENGSLESTLKLTMHLLTDMSPMLKVIGRDRVSIDDLLINYFLFVC